MQSFHEEDHPRSGLSRTSRTSAALAFVCLLPFQSAIGCNPVNKDNSSPTASKYCGVVYEPAYCDQTCQDSNVGFAVDNAGWLLYDENVAGKPSGSVNLTVSCPLSGTVAITGSVTVASNGVNSLQLMLSMTSCGVSASTYSLTFTGSLQMSGTFTSNAQNDVTFSSSSLSIAGQLMFLDNPMVTESCPVSVTDTWNHQQGAVGWLSGAVCGRSAGDSTLAGAAATGQSVPDTKCLLDNMTLTENGEPVEFDDVPATALAALAGGADGGSASGGGDGGTSTTGASPPEITNTPGPLDFTLGGEQPLDIAFTDPTASRPAFLVSLRPRNTHVQCATGCCWGCRITRRRLDRLTSGTVQYQAAAAAKQSVESPVDSIISPLSCAEPGVDPVDNILNAGGAPCTLVAGAGKPAGVTFGSLTSPNASSSGGSGSSGSGSGGSGAGGNGGSSGACVGTCPMGDIVVSTLSCTPLGTAGASNYCLSPSEYSAATGKALPACCAPRSTTGCLDTVAGTLVKPCCSGLTCRVSSMCGDPSAALGGTCLP
jgi:hypothetical protein